MRARVYIVRNDDDLHRVTTQGECLSGPVCVESRDMEVRYSQHWGGTVCQISIDSVRRVRRVCGGIRTPMWVRA